MRTNLTSKFRWPGRMGVCVAGVALLALFVARPATAQCTLGTCNTSYCEYNCPTGADYIVFGSIWRQTVPGGLWSWAGIGVCRFGINYEYTKGSYRDHVATMQQTVDYRVRADGDSSSVGGNDLVRLAAPAGEDCRAAGPATAGVRIYGGLPDSTDTYLFWGDRGSDRLYLCSTTGVPSSSTCLPSSNRGKADGRNDDDIIVGSNGGDELWGGDGKDILYGYAGEDVLHGGSNPDGEANRDELFGGDGVDSLFGDDGNDDLWGEEGCDALNGGVGANDRCLCGDNDVFGEGYPPVGCEVPLPPFTSFNCPGCLLKGEADEADEDDGLAVTSYDPEDAGCVSDPDGR